MKKVKISGVDNYYGDINHFILDKKDGLKEALFNFALELKLKDSKKVELPLDNLSNVYIYLFNKNYEFHLYTREEYVDLVIKTKNREKLLDLIKKFFSLPQESF